MAPEQIAGGEVSARSDVYSLGLVLYEIFTGQRALDGKNLAELIHKREHSGIVPPTTIVKTLDPKIEAGDHALPEAADRRAAGTALASRRRCRAAIRSRRRSRRRDAVAADGRGCRPDRRDASGNWPRARRRRRARGPRQCGLSAIDISSTRTCRCRRRWTRSQDRARDIVGVARLSGQRYRLVRADSRSTSTPQSHLPRFERLPTVGTRSTTGSRQS